MLRICKAAEAPNAVQYTPTPGTTQYTVRLAPLQRAAWSLLSSMQQTVRFATQTVSPVWEICVHQLQFLVAR